MSINLDPSTLLFCADAKDIRRQEKEALEYPSTTNGHARMRKAHKPSLSLDILAKSSTAVFNLDPRALLLTEREKSSGEP